MGAENKFSFNDVIRYVMGWFRLTEIGHLGVKLFCADLLKSY